MTNVPHPRLLTGMKEIILQIIKSHGNCEICSNSITVSYVSLEDGLGAHVPQLAPESSVGRCI